MSDYEGRWRVWWSREGLLYKRNAYAYPAPKPLWNGMSPPDDAVELVPRADRDELREALRATFDDLRWMDPRVVVLPEPNDWFYGEDEEGQEAYVPAWRGPLHTVVAWADGVEFDDSGPEHVEHAREFALALLAACEQVEKWADSLRRVTGVSENTGVRPATDHTSRQERP